MRKRPFARLSLNRHPYPNHSTREIIRVYRASKPDTTVLNYEFTRPGAGAGLTENLVRLFTTIMQVAERQRGHNSAQDFWERTTKQLLRNCIDLVAIARGRLLLQEIYDVIVTAPATPEEVGSEAWQQSSLCWRCIREGEARPKSPRQANDFAHAVKYWLREFPALSSKTRSIIVTSLTSMMDIFLRGTLRELFCTTTNIVPELTHEGAVLVLDLPVKEYAEIGQFSQTMMKFIWQRSSERRDVRRHPRPAFLWCDEAQFFTTATDADFQSTARGSRVATVYLSQNVGAYHSQLGEAETHSVMGNLQTKFFHANGDPMTNNWAAELFSKSWQFRGTAGTSTSEGMTGRQSVSKNFGASDSLDFEVLPQQFTSLRKGGPEHDYLVEAITFQGGRIWHATNKNHLKVGFSPTWRIRPLREKLSMRKGLIGKGGTLSNCPKVAVVKTYPLPTRAVLCRINGHYVFALHQAKEKWQGTLLLERRRKQTLCRP